MKTKMLLSEAEKRALEFVELLRPYCERVEIAGSIRRRKPDVGDIEIVAIPKPVTDLFGSPISLSTDHALNGLGWAKDGRVVANGNKMKKVIFDDVQLDLFIVTPPAEFGVIFAIRTGSAEFSRKLVTSKMHGGLLPSYLKVSDGAFWRGDKKISTPEEIDVFNVIGMQYLEPEKR